ncbi:MAG: hypothetical protein QXJ74_08195 [Nitrososphaera sp.]
MGESLCRAFVDLHKNIQAAVIVSRGEVKERCIRPGIPVPDPMDLEKLFIRAEVFVSMTMESDRLFGETGYVMTNHKLLDTFIFPVPGNGALIVPIVKPYDYHELLKKAGQLLGRDLT